MANVPLHGGLHDRFANVPWLDLGLPSDQHKNRAGLVSAGFGIRAIARVHVPKSHRVKFFGFQVTSTASGLAQAVWLEDAKLARVVPDKSDFCWRREEGHTQIVSVQGKSGLTLADMEPLPVTLPVWSDTSRAARFFEGRPRELALSGGSLVLLVCNTDKSSADFYGLIDADVYPDWDEAPR